MLVIIPVVLFCSSCGSDRKKIDHIFLVTIDTLRADHLSVYDYPRETAPFITSLAEKGAVFKNCFSNSATTNPAHASIFTSYYPVQHRVEKNWIKLNESFITIAEILKENGFETFAFTSSDIFKVNNMFQGFDFFDEPENPREKWNKKYRQAEKTGDVIGKVFSGKKTDGKTFTWIHLFDPHRPYYPPREHLEHIKKMDDKSKIIPFLRDQHKIDPGTYKGLTFSKRGRSDFFKNNPDYYKKWKSEDVMYDQINLYDAEILYTDTQLKRIFDIFEKKGMNKNSLWILTGDHGEGLGNHNWFMHVKEIYKEAVHIPLILYSPGLIKKAVLPHYTEHTDIFPSLLDILRIKNPVKHQYSSSFADLVTGKNKEFKKEFLFAKRETFRKRKMVKGVPQHIKYEHGDKYAIISENFQYIHRTEGVNELFDLSSDPYEMINLISKKGKLVNKLKSFLFSVLKSSKLNIKVKRAGEEEINKIKALGYIE
ncbi:MAG: sulfatase [Acidobacteriota bacterium]